VKESSIRTKILAYLNSLPRSDFEVSPPNSPTAKADITGCWHGRYVAVEVKIPGKKARRAQAYRLGKLRKAGALCIVATSVEDVQDEFLKVFWGM